MTPIELARNFVQNKVQQPALESQLPEKVKNKVRHSNIWLNRFNKVGDLLAYLRRFDASKEAPVFHQMKSLNLLTFEDIVDEFEAKFFQWAQDCTRPSDFIIGHEYSVYDILILARNYETRSGGMFLLEAEGKPAAVVIKATLADGPYPNAWLEQGVRLKYFLKSIDGVFGEHFKPNAAILHTPGLPIYTFTRDTAKSPFVFRGIFHFNGIHREEDGSKWFDLQFGLQQPIEILVDSNYVARSLTEATARSLITPREKRLDRLRTASKKPRSIKVVSTAFLRNPDVVAEVLYRADGKCEGCGSPAPFVRKSDGSLYLEVHHVVQLALGGDDTVDNAIALCPNCHRKSHFG